MSEKDYKLADVSIGCLLFLIMMPWLWLLNAYTMNTLWGWFVTPVFGYPAPGLIVCYGLDLFRSYVCSDYNRTYISTQKTFEKETTFTGATLSIIFTAVFMACVALACGWLAMRAAQYYGAL
jgi:hypothetical protein